MDNKKHQKHGRIGKMINEFYINWNYRRQSWRISFYYNILTITIFFTVVITLIFQQLIKSFDFFINYSCESEDINFVLTYLIFFLVVTCLICILAFFLSRICSILSNYTIHDFMSLGKWIKRIGCTAKWFPWGLALLFIFLFFINIFNLITLYAFPNLWCKRRLNTEATYIVNNCRIFEGRRTMCTTDIAERVGKSNISFVRKCNDLNYLKNNNYFAYVPDLGSENYKLCNFYNINVCIAYKILRYNKNANKEDRIIKVEGCLDNVSPQIEDFYDNNIQTSDLYKYIQIFTIGNNISFFILMFFFYFVKFTTQLDGLFYQPSDHSENFILYILRPLTPWS